MRKKTKTNKPATLLQKFPLFTGNMLSRGWSFTTPGSITGMRGSCIIVPCSFSYSTSQPANLRVIWYLFQINGYPPVFDERQTVFSKFRGKTSLIGSVTERNCSLKIDRLEMSHNQDRIYPWVDKNPITSYHTVGHTFYDKTSLLIVSGNIWMNEFTLLIISTLIPKYTILQMTILALIS